MEILEKIATLAALPAESGSAILITNGQHKNSPFSGKKTHTFGRYGGFWR